jgi:hypothetical protein
MACKDGQPDLPGCLTFGTRPSRGGTAFFKKSAFSMDAILLLTYFSSTVQKF